MLSLVAFKESEIMDEITTINSFGHWACNVRKLKQSVAS